MSKKEFTILYVDDEEINLKNFKQLFFREYNILIAKNAEEALEVLRKNTVHIIVSDQRMPKMQGTDLLKIVAQQYNHIIRIILTGFSDIGAVKRAINEASIFRYLNKPWEKEELRYTFKQALELYKLRKDKEDLIKVLEQSNQNLEKKVEERTSKLREANEMKNHLFSVIAHDLRSPINSLTSALDLFLNYEVVNIEEFKKMGFEISGRLKNVKDLLDNLLHWSMNQDGNVIKAKPEEIDLSKIAYQNYELYKDIAKNKNIEMVFEGDNDSNALADTNMSDFIIRNFVQNSIKFTNQNGKIKIQIKNDTLFTTISVEDNGVGMDKETLEKLFDKKERNNKIGTQQEKGTGLGLKVCAEYAKAQNGKIEVSSEVNKGSKFSLSLPKISQN